MIAVIIRAIGLPACVVIGLLVYYEGIPGASRIPFLASVPIIGDLATGRVHAYAAQQVEIAAAGMVASAELAAAKAQLAAQREIAARSADAASEALRRVRVGEDARQRLEARLTAAQAENEVINDDLADLLSRPVDRDCVVDPDVLGRLRGR